MTRSLPATGRAGVPPPPPDVRVERLRVRGVAGADARRLAGVAQVHLVAALDAALAGVDGVGGGGSSGRVVRIDRLDVALGIDPGGVDDVTLATVWADEIRAAVMKALADPGRARAGAGPGGPSRSDVASTATPAPAPVAERAVARPTDAGSAHNPAFGRRGGAGGGEAGGGIADDGARAPRAAGPRPGDVGGPAPAESAAVSASEPARSDAAPRKVPAADPDAASRAAAVRSASAPPPGTAGPASTPPGPPPAPSPSAQDVAASTRPAPSLPAPAPPVSAPPAPRPDGQELPPRARSRVGSTPVRPTTPPSGGRGDAGAGTPSSVGGLVLLYPWVRGLCAHGEALLPDVDVITARRLVLAAVAAPPDDPLVRLLAGDPRWADPPAAPLLPNAGAAADRAPGGRTTPPPAEVGEAAAEVLAAFAGRLPGFGASSAAFVRENWLVRGASLQTTADGAVLVRLERRPLDLVLDRLPYPLGAFRLPWTPMIGVTWRRP